MGPQLQWVGCVSLAFGLFAAASISHAQSPRPWVDPPSESAVPAPNSPAPAARETKPPAAQPPAPSTSTNVSAKEETGKEQAPQETLTSSTIKDKSEAKSPPRKAVTVRKDRSQRTRSTAVKNQRSKQAAQRREQAARTVRNARAERIREGLDAGLEVMTLRTIEFPDGRRVQILTRPQPGALSELMD
jgi:type IV secretory pathway VirB10-like protein